MSTDEGHRTESRSDTNRSATELRSPFAGTPRVDAVRDGIAAVLLLFSLTLPWDFQHLASQRLEVVLVTVVSLASLTVGYLARANAFGQSLTPARASKVRMIANIPYLVLFVAFVLLDAVSGANGEASGIGAAAAVGLAGAVLAAQPREAELADRTTPHRLEREWSAGPVAVAVIYGLAVLTGLLLFLTGDEIEYIEGRDVASTVLSLLVGLAIIGLPLVGMVRRDAAWRLVLVAVALAPLALYMLGKDGAVAAPMVESVHALGPGLIYWPTLAFMAAAPPVRRAMRGPVAPWAGAAERLLTVAIVVAATVVVLAILGMIETDQTARRAILLVLAVLALMVVVIARMLPLGSQPSARSGGFAAAAALLVIGCIGLAVKDGDYYLSVTPVDLFLALVVPSALAVFLLVQMSQDNRGVWTTTTTASDTQTASGQDTYGQSGSQETYGQSGSGQEVYKQTGSGQDETAQYVSAQGKTEQQVSAQSKTEQYVSGQGETEQQVSAQGKTEQQVSAQSASEQSESERVAEDVRLAQDPNTSPETMAEVAERTPETWVHLARNPSTYPELLDWLAARGRPDVDEALAERDDY